MTPDSAITRLQNSVRFLCDCAYYRSGNGWASNSSSTLSHASDGSGSTTFATSYGANRWSSNLNLLAPLYQFADRLRYRRHGDLGKHGEDLAHRYLRARGLLVVARNWRPPQGGGEIDLVAQESNSEGDVLVFVEVKTRTSADSSSPERDVNAEKLISLRRAARDYVRRARADPGRMRFDVISVTGHDIAYFRDAFPVSDHVR
jgi:putative endonuclease